MILSQWGSVPRAQTSATPVVERSRMSKRDFHGGREFSFTRSQNHLRRSNSSWQPGHTWPQHSNVCDQNGNRPRDWATPHQQADPAVRAEQRQKATQRVEGQGGQLGQVEGGGGEGVGAVVGGDCVAGGFLNPNGSWKKIREFHYVWSNFCVFPFLSF